MPGNNLKIDQLNYKYNIRRIWAHRTDRIEQHS